VVIGFSRRGCDSAIRRSIEEVAMCAAQGQVFKLKAKGVDGQPLWAYRYRLEGRGSARPQVGGFATRTDALRALEKSPWQITRSWTGYWSPLDCG
jgi:hypothetical protein